MKKVVLSLGMLAYSFCMQAQITGPVINNPVNEDPCNFITEYNSASGWSTAKIKADMAFTNNIPFTADAKVHSNSTMFQTSRNEILFVDEQGDVQMITFSDKGYDFHELSVHQWKAVDPIAGFAEDHTGKIFVLGTDGKMYNFYWHNNEWTFNALVPNQSQLIDPKGGLHVNSNGKVFCIGTDKRVYNFYWANNKWNQAYLKYSQGFNADADGGLALNSNNIFAISTDGYAYRFYWNGSSWSAPRLDVNQWKKLDPDAGFSFDSNGKVFCLGIDGAVYTFDKNSGYAFGYIHAGTVPYTQLLIDPSNHIFCLGNNGWVYEINWNGSGFSSPALVNNPFALVHSAGELVFKGNHLFFITTTGKVSNYYQVGSNWALNNLDAVQPVDARVTNGILTDGNVYFIGEELMNGNYENQVYCMFYSGETIDYSNFSLQHYDDFSNFDPNFYKYDYTWGNITSAAQWLNGHISVCNKDRVIPMFDGSTPILRLESSDVDLTKKAFEYHPDNHVLEDGGLNLRKWPYQKGIIRYPDPVRYGIFEIECKMPYSKGHYASFWLFNQHWDPHGELDIFEFWSNDETMNSNNVIWSDASADHQWCPNEYSYDNIDLSADYHKYTMVWTPDYVKYYFDGKLMREVTHNVPQSDMSIMVNNGAGVPGANLPDHTTIWPGKLDLKYFKLYSLNGYSWKTSNAVSVSEEGRASKKGTVVYPNPTNGIVNIQSVTDITHIEVYNTIGKMITSLDYNKSIIQLDLSNEESGVYFMHITTANGTQIEKLLIQ